MTETLFRFNKYDIENAKNQIIKKFGKEDERVKDFFSAIDFMNIKKGKIMINDKIINDNLSIFTNLDFSNGTEKDYTANVMFIGMFVFYFKYFLI